MTKDTQPTVHLSDNAYMHRQLAKMTAAWNARKLIDDAVISSVAEDLGDLSVTELEAAFRAALGALDTKKEAHVAAFFEAVAARVAVAA